MSKLKISQPAFLAALVTLIGCFTSAYAAAPDKKPNVVIFLADDLGYGDLATYGGKAQSPNIQKLADRGAMFTDFYAAAPVCSPSRAGLLTGRFPMSTGIFTYIRARRPGRDLAEEQVWLEGTFPTMAEMLKSAGYQTAHFGKWHLGAYPKTASHPHPQPVDHGFDYTFGTPNNAFPSHLNPTNFFRNGEPLGAIEGYSAQIVASDAIAQLDKRDAERPFFYYLAFHEPHSPIASPEDLIEKYAGHGYGPVEAEYLANIENLDSAIGRVIAALEERSLLENTVIVFQSDNGPIKPGATGGLRGEKNLVYDGGIRVPFVMAGPGVPNGLYTFPAGAVDLLPTLSAILSVDDDARLSRDGVNILPFLHESAPNRPRPMAWFFYRNKPQAALRSGDYVLVASFDDSTARTHFIAAEDQEDIRRMPSEFDTFELYDIRKDPGQTNDLAESRPETTRMLALELQKILTKDLDEAPIWKKLPSRKGWPQRVQNWPQE